MSEDKKIPFPENPTPLGLQMADQRQMKPLAKLLNFRLHPPKTKTRPKQKKWPSEVRFY